MTAKQQESKGIKQKLQKLFSRDEEEITVQDLLAYEDISDTGIVRADGAYFAMLEVLQLNSNLLDFHESASVWLNFRSMLNSINIRNTPILQNHFYDVSDFVKDYEQRSTSITNLTPQLEEAREDVLDYYAGFTEERNREQRAFIIFRFNPYLEGLETGLTTGNAKIDDLFTAFKNKTANIDEEEAHSLATSVLEEVCDLAYHLLFTIGCNNMRLNRDGVLDYMYGVLNRDLKVMQRLSDVQSMGMFSDSKYSNTADIIVDAIDNIMEEELTMFYEEKTNEYNDDEILYKETSINEEIATPINSSEVSKEESPGLFTTKAIQTPAPMPDAIEVIQVEPGTIESNSEAEKIINIGDYPAATKEEKSRKRRAEARKRKKERLRAEQLKNGEGQSIEKSRTVNE